MLSPETPAGDAPDQSQVALPDTGNAIQRLGFNALVLFLFFKFSFFHEFLDVKFGVDFHLIVIVSTVCLLCAFGSGRVALAFHDKITWIWFGFMFFMALATVTSIWPGGSFDETKTYVRTTFPLVFLIPCLTLNKKDLSRLLGVLGFACVVLIGIGLLNGNFRSGRMSVDESTSEMTNSNDYAAFLILMLPALAYLTLRPGRPNWLKAIGCCSLGLAMYQILSTGSRGGLLGLAMMALFVVFTGNSRVRFGILVGVPVLVLAAIPFVPRESMLRLESLVSSSAPVTEEALESTESRKQLLKESLDLTFAHPFTGIGPDQFMIGQAVSAKDKGQHGMWHVTHNTWTQISSECGIPAALLYIGGVVTSLVRFFKLRKHPDKEIAQIAWTAAVMLVGFATCISFLSMGYAVQLLVMSGLAVTVTLLAHPPGKPSSKQADAA